MQKKGDGMTWQTWVPGHKATDPVVEQLRQQREALKHQIIGEVGAICESCNRHALALDLHEVWVRRSALPVARQHEIMIRGNCALGCMECHRKDMGQLPLIETQEFKDRFEQRLRILGHIPIIEWWGKEK